MNPNWHSEWNTPAVSVDPDHDSKSMSSSSNALKGGVKYLNRGDKVFEFWGSDRSWKSVTRILNEPFETFQCQDPAFSQRRGAK